MTDYKEMNRAELEAESAALRKSFEEYKSLGLKLDMSRGKPAPNSSTFRWGCSTSSRAPIR